MNNQLYLIFSRMTLACFLFATISIKASMQQRERTNLASYVFALVKGETSGKIKILEKSLDKSKYPYDFFYMTFFESGDILCSKGLRRGKNSIKESVKKITQKCLKEKKVKKEDLKMKVDIVFHFLKDKKKVAAKKIKGLEKEIAIGVHGIELAYKKKSTLHGGSIPATYDMSLEEILANLCLTLKVNNDCFEKKEAQIFRYNTETFKANSKLEVVDLFRYNSQNLKNLNNQYVINAIKKAEAWFFNHVDPETGMLEHVFYPDDDDYGDLEDHLGQMGSAFALLEAKNLTNNKETYYLVRRTLDYYLGFLFTLKSKRLITPRQVKASDSIFILLDGKGKLSYNALLLKSLTHMTDYPNQKNLVAALSQGILDQQKKDGSYKTYFACSQDTEQNEFPGEAMLSLLMVYEKTKDKKYLSAVNKGFKFYRDYWRKNKNKPFIPRHTLVYTKLYEHTKNKELPQFVFEMNDWLISKHQVRKHQYKDMVGGFSRDVPYSETSLYANGINDAYKLAVLVKDKKRQNYYRNSLKAAARYILQTQFTPENAFFLRAADKAAGGFRGSLLETEETSKDAHQALQALIKTAQNKIF